MTTEVHSSDSGLASMATMPSTLTASQAAITSAARSDSIR